MSNIVNNYSSNIVTMFQNVEKEYERNLEVIRDTEEELCDLEHEAELSSPKDMYSGYKLYKAIREARIRRRNAKEANELLKDLYEFFQSQQGQAFKIKIQSIQGNSVKLRAMQERRTYVPRQRSDLTIAGATMPTKPFESMMKDFKQTKVSVQNGKLRK